MSHVWHPFTQHGLGEPIPLIANAEGASLYTADGRRIIDGISSWWVTTHGHCHPAIMAAIREQTEKLDQIIFAGWTHEPAERLADQLTALLGNALPYIFYSDSGSTSVEVALKMALGYWLNRGEPRQKILALEHGYHGDTVGTMSVGARGVYNRAYTPLLFDVETIPFPAGDGAHCLETLDGACRGGAAAFIVEPLILGAGGMLTYPPEILAAMHDICRRHGVIFIADEVMTAWGRTGTLFACEQARIIPDIMCLSKGLTGGAVPLAATLASEEIYAAHLSPDRARMLFHSSSYTANPIACAAALANLEIWATEPVMGRIEKLSLAQQSRLDALPASVRNRRRIGTITAFEISRQDSGYLSTLAPRLLAFFRGRDLLIRPLGNTLYVMPPYCITESDLDQIYASIAEAAENLI